MKKITFKRLSIKNFLSIGNDPVVLNFKPGLNLITGVNIDVPGTKNGVGKSSIIQAFNFVIFGETLSKLTKDQTVNNITNGKAEVVLEFTCDSPKGKNEFKVTRTVNPSSLKVLKDGNDKTRDSIPNTTKYILEVLSANVDIFKNCVIMRANNNLPFLSQGKVDKKKFIEGLFNLDIILKMARSVKDDLNVNRHELDMNSKLLTKEEDNLADYNDRKVKEENRLNSIPDVGEEILSLEKKVSELEKKEFEIGDEKPLREELSKLEKERTGLFDVKSKLKSMAAVSKQKISSYETEIDKLESAEDFCPLCKREYDEDHRKHVQEAISDLRIKLEAETKTLDKTNGLLDKSLKKERTLNTNIRNIELEVSNIQDAKSAQLKHKDTVQSYRDKILTLKNTAPVKDLSALKLINELIKGSEKKIKEQKAAIAGINDMLAKLDVASFILSEDGIRAFIIKKLLDLLNFRVKYYLSKLNSQYSLEFDQYFDETIKNKNSSPVSYNNLSGAESKMLDLACIWSFRDLLRLQGSVEYNVSFYDEILDSSMDALNSEKVCSVLNMLAKESNQSIYIVSHKTDIAKNITGEVVSLEKRNGITVLAKSE